MGLENGSYINQFNETWPLSGDKTSQGDDHLRLIKKILKVQFPGLNGNGFEKAILTNEDELNFLRGVSSNVQDQFDVITAELSAVDLIPEGTRLTFYMPSPPLGWGLLTGLNDYMLRIVSSDGGAVGGSDSPILNNKVSSHTHAATTASAGAHSHRLHTHGIPGDVPQAVARAAGDDGPHSNYIEANGNHTHTVTVQTNAGASDWTPKYADVVLGQRGAYA